MSDAVIVLATIFAEQELNFSSSELILTVLFVGKNNMMSLIAREIPIWQSKTSGRISLKTNSVSINICLLVRNFWIKNLFYIYSKSPLIA